MTLNQRRIWEESVHHVTLHWLLLMLLGVCLGCWQTCWKEACTDAAGTKEERGRAGWGGGGRGGEKGSFLPSAVTWRPRKFNDGR